MWKLYTQGIEGVNSVLKYCAKIFSNLGWKLTSARTVLKKRLLQCKDSASRTDLIDAFVDFLGGARHVAADHAM
eukprot:1530261-Pyramimonas_sp.AAC.1